MVPAKEFACGLRDVTKSVKDVFRQTSKAHKVPKLAMTIVSTNLQVARKASCSGLTVSGGDPFEQSEDLLELLRLTREAFSDILVYTGYTLDEIQKGCAGSAGNECLKYIDVLIDGRYEKKLNTPDCVLRGSSNQTIHFLNEGKRTHFLSNI